MASVVVFVSKTGNTRHVAEEIAGRTSSDIIDLGKSDADLSKYDEVIIGSGVYAGRLPKKIKVFMDENETLKEKKVSFYLCCVMKEEKGQKQLDNVTSKYTFISKKTFFAGKKKGPDVSADVEKFVQSL